MTHRTITFRDGFGNRIPARKFYEIVGDIKAHEIRKYFSFGYLYGTCERVEVIDDCKIIAEFTILNRTGVNAYE